MQITASGRARHANEQQRRHGATAERHHRVDGGPERRGRDVADEHVAHHAAAERGDERDDQDAEHVQARPGRGGPALQREHERGQEIGDDDRAPELHRQNLVPRAASPPQVWTAACGVAGAAGLSANTQTL